MCLKAAAVNLVESINAKKLSVQAFISCLVTKVMEVHDNARILAHFRIPALT